MYLLKKSFLKSWIAWALLICLSGLGIFFSFRFFSKTFPIVDLEITMDRQGALRKAQDLAVLLNFNPKHYKQAVSFDNESEVQNYIELEAGGPKEFGKILKEGDYAPYFWKVRHFKEYDANETELFFTPDGKPYGFLQKIAEDEPGAALTSQEAQAIAVAQASAQWNINFTAYKIVETGQEATSQGRIDHTFVFKRTDKKVGEAPYRLKLIVRGDRLTELKHSVKIPERFERKYQEMRSSNNFIAFMALIVMIILYIFCGCFVGLFFLVRWSWLEIKWPFLCAFFLSILQLMNDINQIPFYWFEYDTAVSMHQFFGHIVIKIIYHFFMYLAASWLLITIAEGLTRKAFPKKIQLWKVWSLQAGSSMQVLGRTLGGYLLLGFDMAYCIGFYYLAFKFLGWWSPSDALYNPNALATYFPWLSPIAQSLSAGFLEECLFRAIPIAGAALLGDRFGKRNLFIGIAFILQAIIFGAAHANYPAQPAYARLIELLIPSFIFGLTYIWYGLLPSILSHFIFDVVWFSLPIFISKGSSILFDKCMILLICLLPLVILIMRRLQQKTWIQLPSYFYNEAWKPRPVVERKEFVQSDHKIQCSKKKMVFIVIIGAVSWSLWFLTTRFDFDTIPLFIHRNDAISIVQKNSIEHNFPWTSLATIEVPHDFKDRSQHIYIWRTYGQEIYNKLLKSYLMPPLYKVRFVRFEGSTDERSKEYEFFIGGTKSDPILRRMHHKYPETFFLESLSKEQALNEAYSFIAQKYNLTKDDLIEISALPTQRPERMDWKFIFNDVQQKLNGNARIALEIAGKNIVDAYRYVFVPEQWDRMFKDESAFISLLDTSKLLLFIFLIGCASLLILVFGYHSIFISLKMFFAVLTFLLFKSLIQGFNIWPIAIANFNTSEPFNHQAWHVILFWIVYAIFIAVSYALVISFVNTKRFKSPQANVPFIAYCIVGVALGLIASGYFALAKFLVPHMYPQWPTIPYAAAYLPWMSQALSMVSTYIEYSMFTLIIFTAIDYLYEQYRWLTLPFLMVLGFVMLETRDFMPIWSYTLVGLLWGVCMWLMYWYVLRNFRASIPCIIATIKIVDVIPTIIFNAYPGILLGGTIGSAIIILLALWWSYEMYSKN